MGMSKPTPFEQMQRLNDGTYNLEEGSYTYQILENKPGRSYPPICGHYCVLHNGIELGFYSYDENDGVPDFSEEMKQYLAEFPGQFDGDVFTHWLFEKRVGVCKERPYGEATRRTYVVKLKKGNHETDSWSETVPTSRLIPLEITRFENE